MLCQNRILTTNYGFTKFLSIDLEIGYEDIAVKQSRSSENKRIAKIIENRTPAGPSELVRGWHNLLADILKKTAPFMKSGHLVTFQKLRAEEKWFFENIHRTLEIPSDVGSIYIPPSVRHQMMYHRPDDQSISIPDHYSSENPPDMGVLLACRSNNLRTVVNALLAKPPFAPAVDVYDAGQLLAGYVYDNVDECIAEFSNILRNHLQPPEL